MTTTAPKRKPCRRQNTLHFTHLKFVKKASYISNLPFPAPAELSKSCGTKNPAPFPINHSSSPSQTSLFPRELSRIASINTNNQTQIPERSRRVCFGFNFAFSFDFDFNFNKGTPCRYPASSQKKP
ncbi:hypothetical protein SAMN05216556_13010 [Aequorivita viscosa]|uniref:Uncharacterized protein n=1 Tax=Aequorivita viscosa TaxID=797419 RepID=A0A1M6MNA0_9FLAO|nr:hypothetical protein SAMN05216556_13010 [Aequorivita viscosa]SHJ84932.1 hypothetical protein SAMN04487908_12830 [Aequorivita viscosa]